MVLAVCPGSFDPFTLGHLDVVRRARCLADEVVVLVAHNAAKRPLLPVDTRAALIRDAVSDIPGVRVEVSDGLLADELRDLGASVVVKGLRGGADFDAELPMALMNRHLSGVETAFVVADPALAHVASSLVKDVARHGGTIDDLVTPAVAAAVRAALAASSADAAAAPPSTGSAAVPPASAPPRTGGSPTPRLPSDLPGAPTPTPRPDGRAVPTPTPHPDRPAVPTLTPHPDRPTALTPTPTPHPDRPTALTPTPTPHPDRPAAPTPEGSRG